MEEVTWKYWFLTWLQLWYELGNFPSKSENKWRELLGIIQFSRDFDDGYELHAFVSRWENSWKKTHRSIRLSLDFDCSYEFRVIAMNGENKWRKPRRSIHLSHGFDWVYKLRMLVSKWGNKWRERIDELFFYDMTSMRVTNSVSFSQSDEITEGSMSILFNWHVVSIMLSHVLFIYEL